MRIIIPRIPPQTTTADLRRFAAEVLANRRAFPFSQPPEIEKCGIITITDTRGVLEHHGLLSIQPEKAGEWFLSHIRGQRLHQKLIAARRFVDREGALDGVDPGEERRRSNLKIEIRREERVEMKGLKQFAQEHGSR
jgi:hypothetical protein